MWRCKLMHDLFLNQTRRASRSTGRAQLDCWPVDDREQIVYADADMERVIEG